MRVREKANGLERSRNALRLSWSREEVCKRLQQIAGDIHTTCCQFGDDHNGTVNYVKGANIAGFVKVTDEVLECGFSGPNGEQRRS